MSETHPTGPGLANRILGTSVEQSKSITRPDKNGGLDGGMGGGMVLVGPPFEKKLGG